MLQGLDDLRARYDTLRGQVERGEITVEQAMESLGHIAVVDADGFEWLIDAYGTLLRRAPGSEPVPCDPSRFASSDRSAAVVSPGGTPDPVDELLVPPHLSAVPSRPVEQDDGFAFPAEAAQPRRPVRLPRPQIGPSLGILRRFRGVLIVTLCVTVVALLLVRRPHGPVLPVTPGSTTAPSVTDVAVSSVPPATVTVAPVSVPVDIAQITVADAETVVAKLSSGDRDQVAAVAPAGVQRFQLLMRAAQYAGYHSVGFSFSVKQDGPGVFVLTLKDGKETLTRFRFALAVDARGVVLAAWPESAP